MVALQRDQHTRSRCSNATRGIDARSRRRWELRACLLRRRFQSQPERSSGRHSLVLRAEAVPPERVRPAQWASAWAPRSRTGHDRRGGPNIMGPRRRQPPIHRRRWIRRPRRRIRPARLRIRPRPCRRPRRPHVRRPHRRARRRRRRGRRPPRPPQKAPRLRHRSRYLRRPRWVCGIRAVPRRSRGNG